MTNKIFGEEEMATLWRPKEDSSGEDNGQVTIIGGSELFTGAPLLSLIAASRIVDMVFLATPGEDKAVAGKVILFEKLKSCIWVPREEIEAYVAKSDAVLIGPGMMRYRSENPGQSDSKTYDEAGTETKMLTHYLLGKFPAKRWVIDGGSLQVMDADWIPKGAILTPNRHEFEILFENNQVPNSNHQISTNNQKLNDGVIVKRVEEAARKYSCVIAYKGPVGYVSDGETAYEVTGGNAGLTKGGTGDVLAGVVAGLAAKNPPLLSAAAGMWLVKKAAERLYEEYGYGFNADDVAREVFKIR